MSAPDGTPRRSAHRILQLRNLPENHPGCSQGARAPPLSARRRTFRSAPHETTPLPISGDQALVNENTRHKTLAAATEHIWDAFVIVVGMLKGGTRPLQWHRLHGRAHGGAQTVEQSFKRPIDRTFPQHARTSHPGGDPATAHDVTGATWAPGPPCGTLVPRVRARVLWDRCNSEPAVTVRDPFAASDRLTRWKSWTDGESPDGKQHVGRPRTITSAAPCAPP